MMTIHSVYIEDVTEEYAPPASPLLEVSGVGNVVYLSIVTQTEETSETVSYETLASVAVDIRDLLAALASTNYVNVYGELL